MTFSTVTSAVTIQQLLGHVSAAVAVVPHAKLCMRPLLFLRQFHPHLHSQTKKIYLTPQVKASIHWWTTKENSFVGSPFHQPTPHVTLTTDASLERWGAHLDCLNDCQASSPWSPTERLLHINFLELQVILYAIRTFLPKLSGHQVAILSDNTTAVSYINCQGGTVSHYLCKLAIEIWKLCITNGFHISVTHVPGTENNLADSLSRRSSVTHEWELNDALLWQIFHKWGKPLIDVFAIQQNSKCTQFCVRGGRDPMSMEDGLLLNWSNRHLYLFLPLPLITKVLQKLQDHPAEAVVIPPWWPRQHWFPILL